MEPDETVCFCFGYTRRQIVEEVQRLGRSLILEEIAAQKRLGACACALKNPKGT